MKKDNNGTKTPCLNLVHALVQKNKLYFTCFFRSNDIYDGWPRNAIGLRKLQKMICERTGFEMAHLTIISNSAQIYERCYEKANNIIEKTSKNVSWDKDPNGSILININKEEENIIITHLDFEGKKIDEFKVKSAIEGYKRIAEEFKISDISHGLDIGCELQKAEIAIELKIDYIQDKKLNILGFCKRIKKRI